MSQKAIQTPFTPWGMATGIGSLPFIDPEEALDLIFSELPECPHWPQLPRRGRQEHFVHQFLHPLVACNLLVRQDDRWVFDMSRDDCADNLTTFYTTCFAAEEGDAQALSSFLPSQEAAAGFHAFLARAGSDHFLEDALYVKGQIAGPLTIALELKDEEGVPAYYREDLRDVLVRNLALNARAQARALASLGRPVIVFVDDPGVRACGSRMHLALSCEVVQQDLNTIFKAIHSEGCLGGVHSCEAVDWALLTKSAADIISVDAYRFGHSLIPYAGDLREFLERGGTIAWGIAPTLDDPWAESVESLAKRLRGLCGELFQHSADPGEVPCRSMITPACGTGLLSKEDARRIYYLAAGVSRLIRSTH